LVKVTETAATAAATATAPWSEVKKGMEVKIIDEEETYVKRVGDAGLMPIHEHGAEGVITEIDGDVASLKTKTSGDAWIPLNVLDGYDPKAPKTAVIATTTTAAATTTTIQTFYPTPPAVTTTDYTGPGYMSIGCRRISNEQAIGIYHEEFYMSLSKCYVKCKGFPENKYFGITKGSVCFCAKISPGERIEGDNCNMKCGGQPKAKCGGVANAASTFTMLDCGTQSEEEETAEKSVAQSNLLKQFASWDGESCGQDSDNKAKLDGSSHLSGSVDECKLACWNARGADECHGFTYDSMLSRCTFHIDVVAGERKKKSTFSCYYKMIAFKPVV
jgi:hypothetical protein